MTLFSPLNWLNVKSPSLTEGSLKSGATSPISAGIFHLCLVVWRGLKVETNPIILYANLAVECPPGKQLFRVDVPRWTGGSNSGVGRNPPGIAAQTSQGEQGLPETGFRRNDRGDLEGNTADIVLRSFTPVATHWGHYVP